MRRPPKNAWFLPILALILVLPAAADEPKAAPLYTNADLAKFGEPTSTPGQPVTDAYADDGWKFVTDFIDRQNKQIDAWRAHEIESAKVQNESRRVDQLGRRFYSPYFGLGVFGHGGRRGNDIGVRPGRGGHGGNTSFSAQFSHRPPSRAAALSRSMMRPFFPVAPGGRR